MAGIADLAAGRSGCDLGWPTALGWRHRGFCRVGGQVVRFDIRIRLGAGERHDVSGGGGWQGSASEDFRHDFTDGRHRDFCDGEDDARQALAADLLLEEF